MIRTPIVQRLLAVSTSLLIALLLVGLHPPAYIAVLILPPATYSFYSVFLFCSLQFPLLLSLLVSLPSFLFTACLVSTLFSSSSHSIVCPFLPALSEDELVTRRQLGRGSRWIGP